MLRDSAVMILLLFCACGWTAMTAEFFPIYFSVQVRHPACLLAMLLKSLRKHQ